MAILTDVKAELRISEANEAYDTEVQLLIDTAKARMANAGLLVVDEADDMTRTAIMLYSKANFGYENPDAERQQKAFDGLLVFLANSTDYHYYTITITASEQGEITFDDTTKESNDSGIAIFYSRAKNHVLYIVDSIEYYADITGAASLPPD